MKINKIIFTKEAQKFLSKLDNKVRYKVLYNADKTKITVDNELLKKLDGEIWELRTIYKRLCYRFLCFWDKRDKQNTLVIVTHGFLKKTDKTPKEEINKAEKMRKAYFANK